MVKGLYTAYTGMRNEQRRMDILTNNLANSDTTGFKKEGVTSQSFDDLLAFRIKDSSTPGVDAKQIGSMNMGVKIGEVYTDYTQGPMKVTDNTFDMALAGEGFFTIDFTNKAGESFTLYTRDGNFNMTEEGYLVTQDGDFVVGTNGQHIRLSPTAAETRIDRGGRIYQDGRLQAQIQVTDFEDYDYLEKFGENLYRPLEGATQREAGAKVYEGYLEAANVQTVYEMVQMIATTRAYETNQKVIQAHNDTLQIAANQIGKL